jgi:hypothetical protein|nr:MAG TPA: hypothetical protein [Caudoviricetes sp.]
MVKNFTNLRKLLRGSGLQPVGDNAPKEPMTVLDMLDNRFSQSYYDIIPWSKQHFDVVYPSFVINVFNQYIRYLDNAEWTSFVSIPEEVISDFAYKPGLLAKVIYGSTVLQYLIYAFNDIREPYDLSEEFLAQNGIKVLNYHGIEKLGKLISFKQTEESKKINTFLLQER